MKCFPKELLNQMPNNSGIYRLYSADKTLVYIGRTLSFSRRLREHNFSKEFTYFSIEPADVGLDVLEKKYLEEYKENYYGNLPPLNKKIG
jgi:hypothetical protein